jgi:hypothetical protein
MFVALGPRYDETEARKAITSSRSWAEALRRLGMCPTGGATKVLRKYAEQWEIPTEHFDQYASLRAPRRRQPLDEILIEGSTYSRSHLKQRLYADGLKRPVCELCGQDELWHGRRLSLVLDHINGVRDDNRLSNLRIVCPNCAATLETHCGRGRQLNRRDLECERCGKQFKPKYATQRYCSRSCGSRWDRRRRPRPASRRVIRPPRAQLLRQVNAIGYSATGRRYGVSDNAIRCWLRDYEQDRAMAEGADPTAVEIPTRTWPKRGGPGDGGAR